MKNVQHTFLAWAVSLSCVLLLTGCETVPEATEPPIDRSKPHDGDWVRNISGQPHTHVVRLADCAEEELVITHTHEGIQMTVGLHKHNGCLTCPPKEGIQRIRPE